MHLALLWLAACGEEGATPTEAALEPPPGITLDGPLALAAAVRAPMPLPRRFAAELPATWEELQAGGGPAGEGPPIAFAQHRVCSGDAPMRAAWADRVDDAAATGLDGWSLYLTWGTLASCEGEPEPCAWLRDRYAAGGAPAAQEANGYLLSQCDDDATRALIEAGPLGPTVLWYRARGVQEAGWSPRLEEALRVAVRDGDAAVVREAVSLLASQDPARADRLALDLRPQTSGELREALTVSLWRSADPGVQALVADLCASPRAIDPATQALRWPECDWRVSYTPGPQPSPADLDAWVRTWTADPLGRAALHPEEEPAIEAALTRCVVDELAHPASDAVGAAPWAVERCLRSLAALDRPAAAALAPSAQAAGYAHPGLTYLTGSLLRFAREEDVVRRAREIGLTQGSAARSDARIVTAEDALALEGRRYDLVHHGWAWPVAYDALLADLAAMAPPLAEARFTSKEPVWPEAPVEVEAEPAPAPLEDLFGAFGPAEPEEAAEAPPAYVLHAWLGGERWRTEARDQGDWPDVDATLGLLNRLLEAQGSDLRYAETGNAEVVLAPREALIAADRESMLDLVDPAQRFADEQAARAAGGYDGYDD